MIITNALSWCKRPFLRGHYMRKSFEGSKIFVLFNFVLVEYTALEFFFLGGPTVDFIKLFIDVFCSYCCN